MPSLRTAQCAILAIVMLAGACGKRGAPSPARENAATAPAAAPLVKPDVAPAEGGGLAAALGFGAGLQLPKDLIPGGDCPPAGNGAAEEIAAQAAAPVPLKPGLTFAYAWMRTPQEEYECLIQVQSVDNDGVNATARCDYPEQGGPFLRRICRADLRSARLLHTVFGAVKVIDATGKEAPETIVGATAFSLSSAQFAALTRTGSWPHHYVELGPDGQLIKDGVGELHVEGRSTMQVVVNDRPIAIPVIKTRGTVKWWIHGQRLETADTAVILDNEQFPLLIEQQSSNDIAASRIQFSKISYPHEATNSPLERELLEQKHADVYGIYFDFNSDRIRKESEPVLNEIGGLLQRHPDWGLSIEGHTDNVGGNTDYNVQLSQRRSDAVRAALITRFGVSADRLSTAGHGAASPKDTNDTPEGRARNRRVELVRR